MNKNWLVLDIKNFIDVSGYLEEPPKYFEREQSNIINGRSFSRYNAPQFKPIHYECKNKLESILGEKLYPTYYYDRFYFSNTSMKRHIDRESCEISVSLNISSNLDQPWPIWFDINGKALNFSTNPGDAVLYKGMQVPHWRDTMKGNKKSYYHQLFLHYVRADGHFLEFAFDQGTSFREYDHSVPPPIP